MLRLLVAAPLLSIADLNLQWADFGGCCFQNRTICNKAAGFCRSLAHFVVIAETDPAAVIRGGATYSLDGSVFVAGGSMVREAKPDVQHGPTSQSINWGYDAVAPYAVHPQGLPSEICAAAWVHDVLSGEQGELPAHCLRLGNVEDLPSPGSVTESMASYFDAEHSQAGVATDAMGVQRLLVHADARVAAPNVVDVVGGSALCTLSPEAAMTPCGNVAFEQQVVETNIGGTMYSTQVLQFVHDIPVNEVPTQVCFKVSFELSDFPSSPMSWLARPNETYGTDETVNCLDVVAL